MSSPIGPNIMSRIVPLSPPKSKPSASSSSLSNLSLSLSLSLSRVLYWLGQLLDDADDVGGSGDIGAQVGESSSPVTFLSGPLPPSPSRGTSPPLPHTHHRNRSTGEEGRWGEERANGSRLVWAATAD